MLVIIEAPTLHTSILGALEDERKTQRGVLGSLGMVPQEASGIILEVQVGVQIFAAEGPAVPSLTTRPKHPERKRDPTLKAKPGDSYVVLFAMTCFLIFRR